MGGLRIATYNRTEFALLLNEFCDQAGPAGLVRCAETGAGVAVKIFVKPKAMLILPVVHYVTRGASERPLTIFVAQPEFNQPIGKLVGDFFERQKISRAGRAFHFEIVTVVVVKLLE